MKTLLILTLALSGCSSEDTVRSAAGAYASYGRVDDALRAALTDCKVPAPAPPRQSASRDEATHGRKEYYLFAKDRVAYLQAKDTDQPEGQVVVKESWIPGTPRVRGPLFLMVKSGGDWIYATATPDGKEITASGKLASCTSCHESERTRDRMFGLPPAALLLGGCTSQDAVRSAARTYAGFGRVDEDLRIAPMGCRSPERARNVFEVPSPPRMSASRDEATHGKKEYYLFAKDRSAYLRAKDVDQPEGQVIVKESWFPGTPRVRGPLFLMMKSGGDWTYATASPDGKEITAWGNLASCRQCHESDRTRDRMFGLGSCGAAR
jgi:cytochrome c553